MQALVDSVRKPRPFPIVIWSLPASCAVSWTGSALYVPTSYCTLPNLEPRCLADVARRHNPVAGTPPLASSDKGGSAYTTANSSLVSSNEEVVSTTTITTRFEQRGSSPTTSLISSYENAQRHLHSFSSNKGFLHPPPLPCLHHHRHSFLERRRFCASNTTTSLFLTKEGLPTPPSPPHSSRTMTTFWAYHLHHHSF